MTIAARLAEPAVVIAPPALLPLSSKRAALLESEVDELIERAGNLGWLFFAGECGRLMCASGLDPDGCDLDAAREAYDAGLTPGHYVYALHGFDALALPPGHREEGRAYPPRPSSFHPLSALDYEVPGPPFPMRPPSVPRRSQLAATACAACVAALTGAAITALMLVRLPEPRAPLLASAHASAHGKVAAAITCPND